MAKKSTRVKAQDHQEAKPPSIEDAREALLELLVCWAWYLDIRHVPRDKGTFYLARIDENHSRILDLELRHNFERQFDPILDAKTDWLGFRAVQIASGIGAMITAISLSQDKDLTCRQDVVSFASELGLPSKHFEALSIAELVSNLTTQENESVHKETYPGLKTLFENLHRQAISPTRMDVAKQYLQQRGYPSGLHVDKVYRHIKNHSRNGAWVGSKHLGKREIDNSS